MKQKAIRSRMPKRTLEIPSPEVLRTSGLTEREAMVWYVLATHDPLNVTEIGKKAALHRPAIYQLLESLIQKKLAEAVKGLGRVRYSITDIQQLSRWSASCERAFVNSVAKLQMKESERRPHEVRLYHGKDLRHVWEDLANCSKKTVFYRYDAYPSTLQIDSYIPQEYIEGLKNRGLERFVITNQALRKRSYVKRIECASRMFPGQFDPFEQGISQFIYGDNIAFVDFTTETAFVIKNQALANFHLKLFKYLYRTLGE